MMFTNGLGLLYIRLFLSQLAKVVSGRGFLNHLTNLELVKMFIFKDYLGLNLKLASRNIILITALIFVLIFVDIY